MPYKDQKGWKNLRERGEAGDYDLVLPLDLMIMETLPKEGTLFGGLYPIGKSSVDLANEDGLGRLPLNVYVQRLRTMETQGLLVKVKTLGDSKASGFQITGRGQKLVKKLRAEGGDSGGDSNEQ